MRTIISSFGDKQYLLSDKRFGHPADRFKRHIPLVPVLVFLIRIIHCAHELSACWRIGFLA